MTVTCPYCQKPAALVGGSKIYPLRPDLFDLKFWRCFACRASVGCHKVGAYFWLRGKKVVSDGTIPLGRLANAELRAAKRAAHDALDPLWKNGHMNRQAAYSWLAHKLGIPPEDCHIGEFDVDRCLEVVAILKEHRK